MEQPLVSVICLSYNHERFVKEAIESVLHQTYKNFELIVVDDCSIDGSVAVIQRLIDQNPEIRFISLSKNIGNCKAFNIGYKLASGEFVIDFSSDDVMMPERIEKQVIFFKNQSDRVGILFTDATYINENGIAFRNHYEYLFNKKLIDYVPVGNVFRDVLTTYFICSPTMIVRRAVFESLKGYDESLAYEDFDFWVRASREFYFEFLNEKTTLVRKLTDSLSTGLYQKGDKQLHSTFLVCQKAEQLCRDEKDRNALRWRVLYEFKQAIFSQNKTEAKLFADLLSRLGETPSSYFIIRFASFLPLPWALLRKIYYRFLYN